MAIVNLCFTYIPRYFVLPQEPVDIVTGITDAQARKMAAFLQFEGSKQDEATEQIKRLYELFLKLDATQIEINPFGETPDGEGRDFERIPQFLLSRIVVNHDQSFWTIISFSKFQAV